MSLDLKQLLMVGLVEFGDEFKVEDIDSVKCQKCWNHFVKQQIVNDLCGLCNEVVASPGHKWIINNKQNFKVFCNYLEIDLKIIKTKYWLTMQYLLVFV